MAIRNIVIDRKAGTLSILLDLEDGTEISASGKTRKWAWTPGVFNDVNNVTGDPNIRRMTASVFVGTKIKDEPAGGPAKK